MALTWQGDRIISKMTQAQRKGMQVTMGAAVKRAKQTVRVDTTRLQRSIEVISINQVTNGFVGRWGTDDPLIDYDLKQEFGPAPGEPPFAYTPYIRPSGAIEHPLLSARIKAAYRGLPLPVAERGD